MNGNLVVNWWRPETAAVDATAVDAAAPDRVPGRTAFAALVGFTVIQVAAPQEFFAGLQPFRLAFVAAVLAIVCHAYDRLNGSVHVKTPPEVGITLMLAAWAVFMVPFSYWPGGSVNMLFDLYFKSVAVFVLLTGVVNTRDRLRTMAWTLAWCTVPISLVALNHYRTGTFLANSPGRIAGYGTSGLAGNPNDLALLLNLTAPFVTVLAATSRTRLSRLAALGILLLEAGAIIVSFSRSGFLTLALMAVLYLWRLARRRRAGVVLLVVALVAAAVLLAPAGYGDRLSTIASVDSDPTGSAQARWRDTVVAFQFAVTHPVFGAGAGLDYLALNEVRGEAWVPVHNMYLNYAVDLGLVGLGLFLTLFWRVTAGVVRTERALADDPDDELARFAFAARLSMFGMVMAGFFYPIAYQAFFYYFAGLAVAIRCIAARERHGAAGQAFA